MVCKTLVAYASKGGATKQASEIIAEVLKERYKLEVDLIDLRKSNVKIQDYLNIVVGAGVRGGARAIWKSYKRTFYCFSALEL